MTKSTWASCIILVAVLAACNVTPISSNQIPASRSTPSASLAPQVAAFNAGVRQGIKDYVEKAGVSGLWEFVDPNSVGFVADISIDKQWAMYQTADQDRLGYLIPGQDIWLVNLRTKQQRSLSHDVGMSLRLAGFSSGNLISVATYSGAIFLGDVTKPGFAPLVEAKPNTYISSLTWNPEGTKLGFIYQGPDGSQIAWSDSALGQRNVHLVPMSQLQAKSVTSGEDHGNTVNSLEWSGGVLKQRTSLSPQAWGGLFQAGTVVPLKLPYSAGDAYMSNGYSGHAAYCTGCPPGLDFVDGQAADGKPVLAAASGTVSLVAYANLTACNVFGNGVNALESQVNIEHLGTNNSKYTTEYLHQKNIVVTQGQGISQGNQIGSVSCVGDTSNGAGGVYSHIHFQMWAGTTTLSNGNSVLPEPIDGNVDIVPGRNYTSTNGTNTPTDQVPSGYSLCATEGSRCSFSGNADVIYGTYSAFTQARQFSGGVDCTNAVFGDPASGATKRCYQKPGASTSNCNPAPSAFTYEISDNSGSFHTGGLYPQYWWRDGSNGSGSDSAFTYTVTGSQENYAWWDVSVAKSGTFDVYAFIPNGNGGSGLSGYPTAKAVGASYNLEIAGGSPRLANVSVNQEGACGWVKLFSDASLTAGQAYAVSMGDSVGANPANRRIYYDNIALIQKTTTGGTGTVPTCADPGLTVATSDESGFTRGGLYPQYWYTEGTNGGGGRSTFTYTVNGGDQNFAAWDLNPTIAGIYDVYVYSPTPTEDTRPLGSYGNQNPAVGVIYELLSTVGNEVAASARLNQTRGCWQKVMANIQLNANGNYALRLGDNVTGAADSKLYFDTVGLKLVQPIEANWGVSPGALTFNATVGNSPANQTFTITNTGNATGSFGMGSSNNALVTASGYATTLASGASTTATVTVGQCSAVGTTNGQLTINGSNKSATVAITRVCSPLPTTTWQASPTNLSFSDTVGGGAPAAKSFGLSNPGANGTYSISSNQTWLAASPASAVLNSGQNANINVTVSDCSSAITENGVLTISGGGSTASVNVTRTCNALTPSTPSLSSITMSSNGRIFIAWPEVSGATQYDFQATFGGAAISVTGQAPNRGGVNGSAVATFLSAPDAADKQGKQVCFSMRATNTGSSSAFSSFACTTYKYYAGGLSVQSSSDVPRLTLK
jgi:murein DD-endopeptidase MepM/ murein hydrolase activator NlpD